MKLEDLNKIPEVVTYRIKEISTGECHEQGLALIKDGKLIKMFPSQHTEETISIADYISQEAKNYLKEKPYTYGEISKTYLNKPEKGLQFSIYMGEKPMMSVEDSLK